MGFTSRIFLKGLVTTLPLVLTIAVVGWLAGKAENILGGLLSKVLLDSWYIPGMGLIAGILLVFAVGLLTHIWLIKKIVSFFEGLLLKIPVVKSIYSAMSDFFKYLAQPKTQGMNQVVSVEFPGIKSRAIGFVTRDNIQDLPDALGDDQTVAVYFPMSFQIAGYTLYINRSQITPLPLSLEEGMRLVLTGGITKNTEGGKND